MPDLSPEEELEYIKKYLINKQDYKKAVANAIAKFDKSLIDGD